MTHEEIVAYQTKEREFLGTPVGKAFHKFKNAHFKMASNEYNERAGMPTLKRDDEASRQAEHEFRAELDRLREEIKQLCQHPNGCDLIEALADLKRANDEIAKLKKQNEALNKILDLTAP